MAKALKFLLHSNQVHANWFINLANLIVTEAINFKIYT